MCIRDRHLPACARGELRGPAGTPAWDVDPRPAGGAVAGRSPARTGACQPVAGRDLGAEDRLLSAPATNRRAAAARMYDRLDDPVAHLYRARALRPAPAHRAGRRARVCAVWRVSRPVSYTHLRA